MGNSDSRAEFHGLVQAMTEEELPVESPLWAAFFELQLDDPALFKAIQPDHVRRMLEEHPERLQTLLLKALRRMQNAVEEEVPRPATCRQALNAVRLFTRVLPFVLERAEDGLVDGMLWDPACHDEVTSLGQAIVSCVGRLLFLPGFTLAKSVPHPEPVPPPLRLAAGRRPGLRRASSMSGYEDEDTDTAEEESPPDMAQLVQRELLWFHGVGSLGFEPTDGPDGPAKDVIPDASLNRNRLEVLRLLLVCQSAILFVPPNKCKPEDNKWIRAASLVDSEGGGIPFARELLCSLLNVVCTFDPVGWGVPYGSSLRSGKGEADFLDVCLHNLLVLLEVNSWSNIFCKLVEEVRSPLSFRLLFDRIVVLLEAVPRAKMTLLPGSVQPFASYQEVLVLLWKLLDCNKAFMTFVLDECDVTRVVGPICYFMWTGRKNASDVGLLHICTFLILLLSGERSFGVGLNRQYAQDLPLQGAPKMHQPNFGDLMVVVFHKVIVDGSPRLHSLFNCYMTVLSNISPYIKGWDKVSAMRLLSLFNRFTGRRFLSAAENNNQYIFFLLDVFNNAIQYQYEGNAPLVYGLCVEEQMVRRLVQLEFEDVVVTPPAQAESKGVAGPAPDAGGDGAKTSGVEPAQPHFQPTREWFESWKSRLATGALVRMLDTLVPKVSALCTKESGPPPEQELLQFIRNTTMVGLLPVPHPIVIRRYQPNHYTTIWFTTYTWGVIFLRNQDASIWDANKIRLFTINVVPNS